MPVECVATLSNGRKCRCMATRGHAFCRHHGAPRKPRPSSYDEPWNRRSAWLFFSRELDQVPEEEIPWKILYLLDSLLQGVVSDRYAGRCLRVLLQRCGTQPLTFPEPPGGPMLSQRLQRPSADPDPGQLLRAMRSIPGVENLIRAQPSNAHLRPSAPAPAAVR